MLAAGRSDQQLLALQSAHHKKALRKDPHVWGSPLSTMLWTVITASKVLETLPRYNSAVEAGRKLRL